jgi:hypothetical protein
MSRLSPLHPEGPMPVMRRRIHHAAAGPFMEDEDWWDLVLDTEAKRFFVEHTWEHAGAGEGARGIETFDVESVLQASQDTLHGKLMAMLKELVAA